MALKFDVNSRVKYGGELDFKFGNFENCLSHEADIIGNLKDDCTTAFTVLHGEDSDDDSASVESDEYHNKGSTYFQQSDVAPRCCLEELALSIFRFHTKNATFEPTTSGAEWWTQVVDDQDDIGFHWDRDYGHEGSTGENLYPHLATVTYLTNRGGPTVILNKIGCLYSQDCHSGPASDIVVSKPVLGKHIKFDGRLLHAAPSNLISSEAPNESDEKSGKNPGIVQFRSVEKYADTLIESKRVTFLVNIWLNHVPIQAKSFPHDSLQYFSPHRKSKELSNFDQNSEASNTRKLSTVNSIEQKGSNEQTFPPSGKNIEMTKISVPSITMKSEIQLGTLDLHRWNFINGGKKYLVCIPLSSSQRLNILCKQSSAFRFTYSGSGVSANVESLEKRPPVYEDEPLRSRKRKNQFWRPAHLGSY